MKKSDLKKYARLIARMGVNVQKGQDVIVNAAVTDAYFVTYVVEECYLAGAGKVTVDWHDDRLTVLDYRYQSIDSLKEFPTWMKEKWKYKAKKLPALIYIDSDAPDGLKSIDPDKQASVRKTVSPIIWKYRGPMEEHYQWTIVAMPSMAWAKKLFPDETDKKAFELLWNAIQKTTRLIGDPIRNWEEHNRDLAQKCEWLNGLGLKSLIYQNELGTNLKIGLMDESIFCAGAGKTREGVVYQPNMPTEECFTSPDKFTADGTVYAAKPLSLYGRVLCHFGFTFEKGKVKDILCDNEEDRKVLSKLIATDDGASYLGEVALVPFTSPVNQTNLLFYNTLFDENACCHLALGRGFEECIAGAESKSAEEIKALPLNQSVVHTDFMIGTEDLDIVGITKAGEKVQIFKQGVWADKS